LDTGCARQPKPLPHVIADVEFALVVIGRREVKRDPGGKRLSLIYTNLTGANLPDADLRHFDLFRSNLYDANLTGANLYDANLYRSNLSYVTFTRSNLSQAILSGADLKKAYFKGAKLRSTDLQAKNMTPEQIQEAEDWREAKYNPNFRRRLELLPEKP
jgi:uncharacterized protein YjbI with pentapeptide repeats